MTGLIETLLTAPADMRLFQRGDAWITAAAVRSLARTVALPSGDATVFLHTSSAAHFCAGLLAATAEHRPVALPAHTQDAYLSDIGAAALIDDEAFTKGGAERELDGAAPDPLLTFFTSGSTGAPKRVAKNLSRLETEAHALNAQWGADAGHVIATVSHQHIYGLLFRIVWPLLSGRTADDDAMVYWRDLIRDGAGATFVSSPAHLTRLPPSIDLRAARARLVFSSGQMLPYKAARASAAAFDAPVIEVLGSTETGGIAWRQQTTMDAPWAAFPGVEIFRAQDGALSVRSAYLQEAAAYATGDAIDLLESGAFRLRPRADRVVKIEGKRVSLARVEEALSELPEIADASALSLPKRREALGAVAVLTAEGRARLAELGAFRLSRHLRRALAKTLEPAERPKHWRFVDAVPTNTQGKRVLADLRALFTAASPLDALDLETPLVDEQAAEIRFVLPGNLIFFEGHFPARPILPGIAQVHLALLIAQRLWDTWPGTADMARLKFRRVLVPGDHIVLKLKRDVGSGRVSFSFHLGEIVASEGDLGAPKR